MLNFHCPKCNQKIGVPEECEGKTLKCPQCHIATVVASSAINPAISAEKNNIDASDIGPLAELLAEEETAESLPRLPGSTHAGHKPSKKKNIRAKPETRIIIFLVGLIVAVVGPLALWAFVFRDTWELDNWDKISQMCDSVQQLIRSNKLKEGVARHDELLAFIGSRRIKEDKLREDLQKMKTIVGTARKKVAETEALNRRRNEEKLAQLRTLAQLDKKFPRIDMEWKIIPKGYRGYDIKEVYDRLKHGREKLNLTKGTYESQADYNARTANPFPFCIVEEESIMSNDLMPFIPIMKPRVSYDADDERFSVKIDCSIIDCSHYMGRADSPSRDYGLNVDSVLFSTYFVNVLYDGDVSVDDGDVSVDIKCPRNIAEGIADKFRTVYIVRPVLKLDSYTEHSRGKSGDPYGLQMTFAGAEPDWTHSNIFVELNEVWLFRSDTGEVLVKFR